MMHYDDDKNETFNITITQLMDIQTCKEKKTYRKNLWAYPYGRYMAHIR